MKDVQIANEQENDNSREGNTGWRRLIGSPKLQIIFHQRATKHKSLLREMTYKDKGSYESLPPCTESVGVTECSYVRVRAWVKERKFQKKECMSQCTTASSY